jgi:hypothetical protein
MNLNRWIADTGERVVATFLASIATWLTAGPMLDATWVESLVAACIPPVLVVLSSALPGLVYTGPVWWIDAAVRVIRSYLQGFVGALAAGALLLDVSTWQTAAIAGALAAVAAIKTIAARFIPNTITPASLSKGA